MADNYNDENIEHGTVRISDDVIAIIAGVAATEVDGVAGMSGGITGGITEMLGMKNLSKGVKVEAGEKEAVIDLYIIVEYGSKISELGKNVQENVKNTVETMTGLNVVEVNVNIQGVNIPKERKIEVEPRVK
ncbi:Asp23/Gls24 family envelope stress response protein [Tissierella carlieri]|uniref:Asp23/Gls24 family envelope stress response protein n=1 Tax=Tissierella TaxID=41273 RepID=UPI000BA11F7D|nr:MULTISPECIES: Asp23/Gls24 family envelope stress response protein [Tissierella]MBU5311031.1 Asp23/Gls24 family envelope stress response protein [Tissierella carlieri]MDU5080022.1 Asp23/Gls24 family envelope stress response protein [Bacillota bacterium]OZV12775.1 Asp23/Gls24 family envelope stress response protein [Tissierella sp. P1]